MRTWLVFGAFAIACSTMAGAQMKGLTPAEIGGVARARALDLRISEENAASPSPRLIDGMLVSQEVAPHAKLGLGLATMYGRRRGADLRTMGPSRTRKPAVSFVFKF